MMYDTGIRNNQTTSRFKGGRTKMLTTVRADAEALYDGGWRAEDRTQLMTEFDLSEEEANVIADELEKIADRN